MKRCDIRFTDRADFIELAVQAVQALDCLLTIHHCLNTGSFLLWTFIASSKLSWPCVRMQMMRLVLPANGIGILTAIEQYIETMEQSAAELVQQANLTPHQTSQLCTFLLNVST